MRPSALFPVIATVLAAAFATSAAAGHFRTIYDFEGGSGATAAVGASTLISVGGILYGTTELGGASGYGTVYSVTRHGAETLLYSFKGGTDGEFPIDALLNVNGTVYGTTNGGGAAQGCQGHGIGCGTVFSISRNGAEAVLHSFSDHNGVGEGFYPDGPLLDDAGLLYGTTAGGGVHTVGTVFSLTLGGAETILLSFHKVGGNEPTGGVILSAGKLYGTTSTTNIGRDCCGSIYSLTTGGVERTLHAFTGGADGARPFYALVKVGGLFYGTTFDGGTYNQGTAFVVTPKGGETVLHSFGAAGDAAHPGSALVPLNGLLYGIASGGATSQGAIFTIAPNGTEDVVYSFKEGKTGGQPTGGLLDVYGTLYGITAQGGARNAGTIYAFTP